MTTEHAVSTVPITINPNVLTVSKPNAKIVIKIIVVVAEYLNQLLESTLLKFLITKWIGEFEK